MTNTSALQLQDDVCKCFGDCELNLLRRENNLNVIRADIEEMRTEQILLVPVTDAHLSHRDEVLVFTDIVRQAFVTQRVNLARNDKIICPHFY